MNAHQRRVSMTRRHMQWPLGARVVVRLITEHGPFFLPGRVHKHWKGNDHACSVDIAPALYEGRHSMNVNFRRMTLIETERRGERPWYRKPPWSGSGRR